MIDIKLEDADIRLVSLASFLPPLSYTTAEVAACLGYPPSVAEEVVQKAGIYERRSATNLHTRRQVITAEAMAHIAAATALARGNVPPHAVQAIVGVSGVPEHACPTIDVAVQKRLGLDGGFTLPVYGGCGAWQLGTFVAIELLRARHVDTVLLVGAEVLTRYLSYAKPRDALFFGDGAGAYLLSTKYRGPFAVRRLVVDTVASLGGERAEVMTVPMPCDVSLPSDATDEATIAAARAPHARITHRADLASRWAPVYMARAVEMVTEGCDRSEMFLVPHQPSQIVLEKVRERLDLRSEQVAVTSPYFGNTSSVSTPMAFDANLSRALDHRFTVLAPIGTGLVYGATLLENTAFPDKRLAPEPSAVHRGDPPGYDVRT